MRIQRLSLRLLLTALALILVAASCGLDSDDSSTDSGSDDSGGDAADDSTDEGDSDSSRDGDTMTAGEPAESDDSTDAVETSGEDDGGGLAVPTALTAADIGRDIVFRATVGVAVDDVAAAGREATQIVTSLGGIVFGQSSTVDPSPRTVLTFKILPEDFDDALEALAGVGELVEQTISAEDVTDRVVDLESRIITSEASVLRLRGFLEGATNVGIIADLERQLLDRETTLETLRGQLRTLRDQVSLATITLTITEAGRQTLPADIDLVAWLGDDEADACPGHSSLDVTRDDKAVLCIEIENTGDVTLTDITIESTELRLRVDDFEIANGSLDALDPGDRLVALFDLDVTEGRVQRRDARGGLFIDVRVEATPADNAEQTLEGFTDVVLIADGDTPLPGFGDAFGGGVATLAAIGSVLLIILGGALPFLPFIAVVVWFVLRRRGATVRPLDAPSPPPAGDTE
jgi:hypothetical protein